MRVFGILSLSPSSIWRASHNYHHKHNSKLRSAHIGSYPIMTRAQYLKSSRGERIVSGLAIGPTTPLVLRGAAPTVGWSPAAAALRFACG